MEYFKQKIVAGEVGSSAMPHKVNPSLGARFVLTVFYGGETEGFWGKLRHFTLGILRKVRKNREKPGKNDETWEVWGKSCEKKTCKPYGNQSLGRIGSVTLFLGLLWGLKPRDNYDQLETGTWKFMATGI